MTDEQKKVNGWNEWSRFVLKELERQGAGAEKLDAKLDNLSERMTKLQIKVAGVASGVAILTTLIVMLISYFLKG